MELKRPWLLVCLFPFYRFLKRCKPSWCLVPENADVDIYPHTKIIGAGVYASGMLLRKNWIFRLIFPRFFKKIRCEITSEEEIKKAQDAGTVVYVIRQMGQLEYNYFQHLFGEKNFPLASFANDISLRRFMPWSLFKATIIKQLETLQKCGGIPGAISSGFLTSTVLEGQSVLLSLSTSELEDETVLLSYSQRLIASVIEAQRVSARPIYFVPLEFIWDRRPAKTEKSLIDILFGEKENPGAIRKIVLFWRNYGNRAVAKVGLPISLKEIMEGSGQAADDTLARQAGGKILNTMHFERRTVTGPPARTKSWFIERVMIDDRFQQTFCELAAELGKSGDDLRELSERYLSEIAADVNYTYIEAGNKILKWVFSSLFEGVTFNEDELSEVKKNCATKPVVFAPNHKSHVDYLILAYILHNNYMTIPYVAAGINLSFWPLGAIFRHCGAFFIRRSFENNQLYRACVETYLRVLLEEGYTQELFIEGGRSRTGKLLSPRHGMIKLLGNAVKFQAVRDICFVPVSFTYDRVVEQKEYEKELEGGTKEKEKISHILGLIKYLKKQKPRYGRVYVNFGKPISYKECPEKLPENICHEINRNIVVTPQSLVACAILSHPEKVFTRNAVKESSLRFLDYLRAKNVRFASTLTTQPDKILLRALDGFIAAKIVSRRDEVSTSFYFVQEGKRLQLEYFKNSCVHFLISASVFANLLLKRSLKFPSPPVPVRPARPPWLCRRHAGRASLDMAGGREGRQRGEMSISDFLDDFLICKRLLSHEFKFAESRPVEKHIQRITDYFISKGILESESPLHNVGGNEKFCINNGADTYFRSFSNLVRNFFESLEVALISIKQEKFVMADEKEIIKKMLYTGKNMLLLGHVRYRESISKSNFANALRLFCDLGVLRDHAAELGVKGRQIYTTTGNKDAIRKLQVELEGII